MSVPNHAQVNRIAADLNALASGDASERDWHGNSYAGITGYAAESGRYYTLIHWSTPIAQFHVAKGKVRLLTFNARYLSATTRSFQGRIYQALCKVHAAQANDIAAIGRELGRPTAERGILMAGDALVSY